jgi:uncharacterized membrane protein
MTNMIHRFADWLANSHTLTLTGWEWLIAVPVVFIAIGLVAFIIGAAWMLVGAASAFSR